MLQYIHSIITHSYILLVTLILYYIYIHTYIDEAKDAMKAYVLENKESNAISSAGPDKAAELPMAAMNVSSIHSEQSITSAHYVNTGKVQNFSFICIHTYLHTYMVWYTI